MNDYWCIGWHAYELTCSWCYSSDDWVIIFICCCSSVAQLGPTLCSPMDCSIQVFPVLHHLLELTQTHVHWVTDAIQASHPLSSPSPPAFHPSQCQGLFQWVSSLLQVVKVLELHFSISPFNEHSRLISFRTDWFDLIAVQGTVKWMWKWKSFNHVRLFVTP